MKHFLVRLLFVLCLAASLTALVGCGNDDESRSFRYTISEDAFTLGSYSFSEDGTECSLIFYCRNSLDGVTASVTYLDREGREIGSDRVTKPISFSSTTNEYGEITLTIPEAIVGKAVDLRVTFEGTSKIDPAYSIGWHTVVYTVDGSEYFRQTVMHGNTPQLPTDLPEKSYGLFVNWVDSEGNVFDFNTPVIHNVEAHATFVPDEEKCKNITVAVTTAYETADGKNLTVSGCGILFYRSNAKNRYYLLTADSLVRPADAVSASYTVTDAEGNTYNALTFPVIIDGEAQEDFDARVDAFVADADVTGLSVLYFVSNAKDNLALLRNNPQSNPEIGDELLAVGWEGGHSSVASGKVTEYVEKSIETSAFYEKCSFNGSLPILTLTTDSESVTVGGGLMSIPGLFGIIVDVQTSEENPTVLTVVPISTVMQFLNLHVFAS